MSPLPCIFPQALVPALLKIFVRLSRIRLAQTVNQTPIKSQFYLISLTRSVQTHQLEHDSIFLRQTLFTRYRLIYVHVIMNFSHRSP